MGEILAAAIGLMLVLEGLLPLTLPSLWREIFRQMLEMRDGQIRFIGLASVGIGVAILFLSR